MHIHPDNLHSPELYGATLLGSPIGSDAFKTHWLQNKIDELQVEAEKLKAYGKERPQGAMLLLQYCFSNKFGYLLRTIEPRLSIPFLQAFNDMVDDIYASILCFNKIGASPEARVRAHMQSRLGVLDGGNGIGLHVNTAHAAFVASFLATFQSNLRSMPSLLPLIHSADSIPLIREFRNSVSILDFNNYNTVSIFTLSGIDIQSGDVVDPHGLHALKLQSKMMSSTMTSLSQHFDTRLSTLGAAAPHELARVRSCSGRFSSAFVNVAPKTFKTQITAAQYRMTCYRRLGLPLPQILEGQRCNCKREPLLDRKGIHCVTGCPRGGGRQRIHNEMNYEVAAMCKSAGLLVTIEPANAFIGLDAENRKRPDLRVQGLLEQPIYTDIQITEPCSSNLTLNRAGQSRFSAKEAERVKEQRYAADAAAAGHQFFPLIIETYVAFGPKFEEFFGLVMKHAAEYLQINVEYLSIYWRRRLSASLHKAIASSIVQKLGRQYSAPFRDESGFELLQQEQAYARV